MGILGGGSTSTFDKFLESATSQLQLEPNWAAIIDICDSIRQKDTPAKYAVQAIKRKTFDKNPHVSKFALVVLEACMKNCGSLVHDEVATREFMDDLRSLVKTGSEPVKEKVLELLQTWNSVFRNKTNYKIFQDTYNLMKMEGYNFPPVSESDLMFSAEIAPEWAEGDVCNMCRVKFSTFTRQHHCRCCGQVFCGKCSAKTSLIPKFGIEKEVRVCDPCYDNINPKGSQNSPTKSKGDDNSDLPAEYLNHPLSKEAQVKPKESEDELKAQEEEDLQLAMALSLSTQDNDQSSGTRGKWSSLSAAASAPPSASAPPASYPEPKSSLYSDVASKINASSDQSDPELSRYLNRSYWEQKKQEKTQSEPSAPLANGTEDTTPVRVQSQTYVPGSSDNEEEGSDVFVQTMKNSLEMFIERMQSVTAKGKHIAMDTSVQSLFQSLSAMHPQLMRLIEEQEDQKAKYEAMLQKVAIIREARESLDDVRAQHKEKLRQQELEQEMLRRMQMEQKLELMRQQKHEYLEYQRQLQIQRQQELEVQQHAKAQQKQVIQQYPGYPYNPAGDPSSAAQYPGYGQYPPTSDAYPAGQISGQYPNQGGLQPQNPQIPGQGVEQHAGYPVSSMYGQYSGPVSYTSQTPSVSSSLPPGQQQEQVLNPALAQQRLQVVSQAHVPPIANSEASYANATVSSNNFVSAASVQGLHQGIQPRPMAPQTAQLPPQQHVTAQVQPTRQSPASMADLLDAPIGSEVDVSSDGYQGGYGMSGPNSQDFNQHSYNQPHQMGTSPTHTRQRPPQGQMYADYPPHHQHLAEIQRQGAQPGAYQQQPIQQQQPQQHIATMPPHQLPSMQPPSMQQPSVQQPSVQQPSVQQPSVQQPSVQQPSVQQPSVQQPSVQQPSMLPPNAQQTQQHSQFPQQRFGQPQQYSFDQPGHLSPRLQHQGIPQGPPSQATYPGQAPQSTLPRRHPQEYQVEERGAPIQPPSLQYVPPPEQLPTNRGPASMPPTVGPYHDGTQAFRPHEQEAMASMYGRQPPHGQMVQQPYHAQPSTAQDVPANSHLKDMELISFD